MPVLIVPNISIFDYGDNHNEIDIATRWTNEELKDENVVRKLPKATFFNIGSGASKSR